jgi:hypothetical protein
MANMLDWLKEEMGEQNFRNMARRGSSLEAMKSNLSGRLLYLDNPDAANAKYRKYFRERDRWFDDLIKAVPPSVKIPNPPRIPGPKPGSRR